MGKRLTTHDTEMCDDALMYDEEVLRYHRLGELYRQRGRATGDEGSDVNRFHEMQ